MNPSAWIAIAAVAIISFAIKASGPTVLGDRSLPPQASRVIALLAPALLTGLVISNLLGSHWAAADGPLALGVTAALITRAAGGPSAGCVAAAILVTAAARAI